MKLLTRTLQHVQRLPIPGDASSLVLSVHRGVDVPPDKALRFDMSTGTPGEKKKSRLKNTEPKSQVTPAVQQVHVVLWDEPPKGDPQEDDTDLEPDHV